MRKEKREESRIKLLEPKQEPVASSDELGIENNFCNIRRQFQPFLFGLSGANPIFTQKRTSASPLGPFMQRPGEVFKLPPREHQLPTAVAPRSSALAFPLPLPATPLSLRFALPLPQGPVPGPPATPSLASSARQVPPFFLDFEKKSVRTDVFGSVICSQF